MTIYGPNGGVVTGQPISPFFGAQNGASPVGGPVTAIPANMPMLEAMARGVVPRNTLISTINGVSSGAGDPLTFDEAMASGNGAQVNLGAPVNNSSGNPATNGAINNQEFVGGITGAVAPSANGPAPTNTETLTSAPVSGATLGSAVGLQSPIGFAG